jgi:hypothetical protein
MAAIEHGTGRADEHAAQSPVTVVRWRASTRPGPPNCWAMNRTSRLDPYGGAGRSPTMMRAMRPHFAAEDFRKATASDPDRECVRVARRADRVELRDDKTAFGAPDDHRIVLTSTQFDRFQAGVRSGRPEGPLRLDRQVDGTYLLHTEAVALTFTEPEVRAFLSGVRDHEFDSAAYDSPTAA